MVTKISRTKLIERLKAKIFLVVFVIQFLFTLKVGVNTTLRVKDRIYFINLSSHDNILFVNILKKSY
jgi:hypothetical protein